MIDWESKKAWYKKHLPGRLLGKLSLDAKEIIKKMTS